MHVCVSVCRKKMYVMIRFFLLFLPFSAYILSDSIHFFSHICMSILF